MFIEALLGYEALFFLSFLSSTLLPMTPDALVVVMLPQGFNPIIILLVAVIGNYLGTLVNYYIGFKGGDFILSKWIKPKKNKLARMERWYSKWGAPILFFSWVPFVGDPLTVVAGIFKLRLRVFTFWVLLGKILKFYFIIQATLIILN